MTRLIQAALGNRVLPNLLMVALLVAGAYGMASLTIRSFPEIATGAVSVTVPFPGATPQEVADGIVRPIENEVRSIDGVRKITATAELGLGRVTVDLVRGADVSELRTDIEAAVAAITVFPDAAESPVVQEVEPRELAIQFILSGDIDRATLKDLARDAREGLLASDGISTVEVSGAAADEIGIEIDRATLRGYGLSLTDVARLVAAENVDLSGGTLRSDDTRLQVRALGEEMTAARIADIPLVEDRNGAVVRLGDVARITDGLADAPVTARLDGRPAVYLTVYRNGTEQILDIVETARAFVGEELRAALPDGVTVTEWRNEADNLRGRIDLLIKNGLIGAALIVALLTVFLDLRIAIWVSAGIVVSFVGTFALMLAFGITINQLSLFGFILALGIVVDDAIVVGEAVHAERDGAETGIDAAKRGVARIARPVFFAVSTTIAAFVPLLFLPGTSGSFIAPVAAVVIMVLSMSLAESFFVLPQHLSHLRTERPRRFSPRRITRHLSDRVGGALDRFAGGPMRRCALFSARQPAFVILTCIGLLAGSLAVMTSGLVRFVFFPEIEGNYVSATLELPAGTAASRTEAVAGRISEAATRASATLAERLGQEADRIVEARVIAVGFSPGSGGPGGGGVALPSRATVDLKIEDAETRRFAAEDLVGLWREEVGEVPGARELVFSASEIGVGAPVSLQVSAADDTVRRNATDEIVAALRSREGVFAVRDSETTAAEEVVLRTSARAEALGVPLSAIAEEVRAAIFGAVADELIRDREEVEIRVRLPDGERETLEDLEALRIPVGEDRIPLTVLADIALEPSPTTITRVDARRVTTVEADVDPSVTSGGAETARIRSDVLPDIRDRSPSVEVGLGGEQEEQSRFGAALGQNFLLALFAMYVILALAFQSFGRPLVVLLTVPFGLVGALLGHALLGLNLTLLSLFGIIGLSGIIINASLLIMNEIAVQQDKGADRDDAEIIADATAARFRPIFLTMITTFLGITPLILEQSLQAQFLVPTAVSLGFGILVGSVFVLFLMPALSGAYFGILAAVGHKRLAEG